MRKRNVENEKRLKDLDRDLSLKSNFHKQFLKIASNYFLRTFDTESFEKRVAAQVADDVHKSVFYKLGLKEWVHEYVKQNLIYKIDQILLPKILPLINTEEIKIRAEQLLLDSLIDKKAFTRQERVLKGKVQRDIWAKKDFDKQKIIFKEKD